ncbi:hypothetical protein BH20ACT15_BH20ACT15_06080 [soil metagenome]
MASEETPEEIPRQGTAEQTRLAASAMRRREQQAYGGSIQWEAAFFGWLAAVGLAAIGVAMAIGAGVAVGLTDFDTEAGARVEALGVGGGVLLVAITAISYCAGGYVAGRMARFDGWRQGFGVWLVALAMTAALAATAIISGSDINPLDALGLPRIPIDEEGSLTQGGAIALAATAIFTLLASVFGGVMGEGFHRAVDDAGAELPADEEPRA